MFRHFAVSSMAVVGLLTMAVAPAEAGASTGSWKYWNPYVAQPYWYKPHGGGYAGRGYGHRGYHGYRGGHAGYSQRHHGHAYGHRYAPGW